VVTKSDSIRLIAKGLTRPLTELTGKSRIGGKIKNRVRSFGRIRGIELQVEVYAKRFGSTELRPLEMKLGSH
jgi:hypothetical protein